MNAFSGRLLGAFLALAECGQFKLAAARCNVSQSAFSQMIARLEAQVGARLFDRDTRNTSLTAEGELLLPLARRLDGEIAAVFANLRDYVDKKKGRVRLAAIPSLAMNWLPAMIGEFQSRYPGIALQLFDLASHEKTLDLLRQERIDFALTPQGRRSQEFDARVLFEERFYLVCPPGHKLAGRRSVRFKDLVGLNYIHTLPEGSVRQQLQPFLSAAGISENGFTVEQQTTVAGLVAHGLGISVVPGFALDLYAKAGLAAVPVADKGLKSQLLLLTRKGQTLSVAAQAFMELLEANPPENGRSKA